MKDRGQREWAPIRHNTAPTPNMPRLSVPKPPKQTGAQGVGRAGTDAEKVRNFIREAMANNGTKEQVIDRVVKELNFAVPKAKTYVNGNWAKLEGLNKK